MVTYVPERGMRSPNRFDALVFCVTELRELARERPRTDASAELASAAVAQQRLTQAITGGASSRGGSTSRGSRRIGI
jgi:hypothetical protein